LFNREKVEEVLQLAEKIGGEVHVIIYDLEKYTLNVYGRDAVDRVLNVTDKIRRVSDCGSCHIDGKAAVGDVEICLPWMCKREDVALADIVK